MGNVEPGTERMDGSGWVGWKREKGGMEWNGMERTAQSPPSSPQRWAIIGILAKQLRDKMVKAFQPGRVSRWICQKPGTAIGFAPFISNRKERKEEKRDEKVRQFFVLHSQFEAEISSISLFRPTDNLTERYSVTTSRSGNIANYLSHRNG
jgi:hypothetical protein